MSAAPFPSFVTKTLPVRTMKAHIFVYAKLVLLEMAKKYRGKIRKLCLITMDCFVLFPSGYQS